MANNIKGAFQLVLYVAGKAVPAHLGTIPRSQARALKVAYAQYRPNTETRVVKAGK